MRKLLWIGDACVSTGFARSTHRILDVLRHTWDVSVLGINYNGDPHDYPYPVYPASPGGDLFGLGRVSQMVSAFTPDIIIIQNDPWNIPEYLKRVGNIPTVAIVAVDGKNCRGRGLNGLAAAIFWTRFGEHEAQLGGYSGPSHVIPLGVDLELYCPGDRQTARKELGIPKKCLDAFIIGNVNRNQQRKRLDLCIEYFAKWLRKRGADDAYFFFHTAPTGDNGYDVKQLAHYYGVANHLLLAEPDIGRGVEEDDLARTYRSFDVMLTMTQGEGFGLPTFEGMACGIPQIAPDWSALGELCAGAALLVPCTTIACTPNKINVVGGIADREATIEALDNLYLDADLRRSLIAAGLARVSEDRFRWGNIGVAVGAALDEALGPGRGHG